MLNSAHNFDVAPRPTDSRARRELPIVRRFLAAATTFFLLHVQPASAVVSVAVNATARTATITTPYLTAKADKDGRIKALTYNGRDLINGRTGFDISKVPGASWTATELVITKNTGTMLDIGWKGPLGELHYVFMDDLSGVYSYFIVGTMDTQVEEFRTLYRMDPIALPNLFTMRKGAFTPPTPAQINAGLTIQDSTWQVSDGSIYTKYDSSDYLTDDLVHGMFGSAYGVWFMPVSREAYNGGPMKQELLAHVEAGKNEMIVLNMLQGSHFGDPPLSIPAGKVYGPYLIYLNNGSSEDAISRAKQEEAAWPYSWLDNPLYPVSRTTVQGKVVFSDGRSADGLTLVLAEPISDGKLTRIGAGYWFSAKAAADGTFSIPKVRPGSYTLYAFASKGDITDQFRLDNVAVAGSSVNLGTLNWSPTSYPHKLWSIGTSDRKSTEFKLGDQQRSYDLFKQVPANLNYTVGTSTPKNDWYYVQTGVGKWNINFDVPTTYSGTGHLTVVTAGAAKAALVKVRVNGTEVGTLRPANDGSTYRSSNTGGQHVFNRYDFPASLLKQGANTVQLDMTSCAGAPSPGGISYDILKLEVEGEDLAPKYQDVTASVKVVQSGLTLDRTTQQTKGVVSFTNTTNASIGGPLFLKLQSLTAGVTVVNAAGVAEGWPVVAVTVDALAPGATVTVPTTFANPQRLSISYQPKLVARK